MKKLLFVLFFVFNYCFLQAESETKFLGRVLSIICTKTPTTAYHIVYTTQEGVVCIVENIDLRKDITINTSTYCIHGFLYVEEHNNLMNTKHYYIKDNVPAGERWTYVSHNEITQNLKSEIQNLKSELLKIKSSK